MLDPFLPRDDVDHDLLYYAGFCAAVGFAFMLVGLVLQQVILEASAMAAWAGFWLCCTSIVIACVYIVRRLIYYGTEEW